MTGRKGRVVMNDKTGEFKYESRSTDESVSLEMLNCTEKERFMKGEKNVAIISEAASSGISLQVSFGKSCALPPTKKKKKLKNLKNCFCK